MGQRRVSARSKNALVGVAFLLVAASAGAQVSGSDDSVVRTCGTMDAETYRMLFPSVVDASSGDCSSSTTNPLDIYAPGATLFIPVVVHILRDGSCTQGNIADAMVQSQIDVLNEDFNALAGSLGEPGTDTRIQFALATIDPDGNPTNGIERRCNDNWWQDSGNFTGALTWDPNRYLNIFTNNTSYLGYANVPNFGGVGASTDVVVVKWNAFGRNSPLVPFHLGRTATHEVGHWLGLLHVFNGGICTAATAPNCYGNGDLICDTNPQPRPLFGCPIGSNLCPGSLDPIDNYLNYTDDVCMSAFTPEQTRRLRCTLQHFRPALLSPIFTDGFESGNLSRWNSSGP